MCIVQMIPGMGASKIIGNGFLSVHFRRDPRWAGRADDM